MSPALNLYRRVAHSSALAAVFVAILWTTSSTADSSYPSTVEDYATVYEVNSYHHFRQNSREYENRLEKGKLALRRWKKFQRENYRDGDRIKAAESATLEWFKGAAFSTQPASELPELPVLGDAGASSTAPQPPVPNEPGNSDSNTAENLKAAIAALTANKHEENTRKLHEQPKPAKSNVFEAVVSKVWNGAAKDEADEANGTDEANLSDVFGHDDSEHDSQPNRDADKYLFPESDTNDVSQPPAKVAQSEPKTDGSESNAVDLSVPAPAAPYEQSKPIAAADSIPENKLNLLSEPFPDTQLDSSYADVAYGGKVTQELEAAITTAPVNSMELNARIDGFNAALSGLKPQVREAINSDGSRFPNLVDKIEALADSRRMTHAMADQADESTRSTLHVFGDLQSISRELHDAIVKCPKSASTLPFTKAVNLLRRLKETEAALNQLSHGAAE